MHAMMNNGWIAGAYSYVADQIQKMWPSIEENQSQVQEDPLEEKTSTVAVAALQNANPPMVNPTNELEQWQIEFAEKMKAIEEMKRIIKENERKAQEEEKQKQLMLMLNPPKFRVERSLSLDLRMNSSCTDDHAQNGPKAAVRIIAQKHWESQGFGDLMFAIRLYAILKKSLSEMIEVTLHPFSEEEEQAFKRLRAIPPHSPLKDLADKINDLPTLMIHGPVLLKALPFKSSETTAIWNIHEYSTLGLQHQDLEGTVYYSGPANDELGILFDEDLYEKMSALQRDGKRADPDRISMLQDEHLKELLLQNKDALYFMCYSHTEKVGLFAQAIMLLNESDLDCDIIVNARSKKFYSELISRFCYECTGKEIRSKIAGSEDLKKMDLFKEILPFHNIKSFEVWHRKDSRDYKNVLSFETSSSTAKKRIRLIGVPFLDHPDFKNLLMATQPLVMITGDQSLGEAISAKKVILYDLPAHKRTLWKNLVEQAKILDNPAAADVLENGLKRRYRIANMHEAEESFRMLSDKLYQNHNMGKKITEFLQTFFLLSSSKGDDIISA